jgi:serine/threonine protein kinase
MIKLLNYLLGVKMYCPNCFEENFISNCTKCGYEKKSPTSMLYLKESSILDEKYIIGRVLGKGGFGITYIGFNRVSKQKVAIKEYLPSSLASRTNDSKNVVLQVDEYEKVYKNNLNKFYDEAKILASFSVEGIVKVLDFFYENNTAYMVMSYLEGETLKEYIDKRKYLNFDEIIKLLTPVINSLAIIHRQRLLHRDISPDNIIIQKNNSAVLIDFGAARYSLSNESKNLTIILKPGFAPIEQYTNKNQGPFTDIYALGATIYYCLTKIKPPESLFRFSKDTLKKPTKILENKLINKQQEKILLKAISIESKNRYQNISSFVDEINNITNQFKSTLTMYTKTAVENVSIESDILYDANKTIEKINNKNKKLLAVFIPLLIISTVGTTLFINSILSKINSSNDSSNNDNKLQSNQSLDTDDSVNKEITESDSSVDLGDNVTTGDNVFANDDLVTYILDYNYDNSEQTIDKKIYTTGEEINHNGIIYKVNTLKEITDSNEKYQVVGITIENNRTKPLYAIDEAFILKDSEGNQYEEEYLPNISPMLIADVAPGSFVRTDLIYKLDENKNLKMDISTTDTLYTVDLNNSPTEYSKEIVNNNLGKSFNKSSININDIEYTINNFSISSEPITFYDNIYTCTLDITIKNNSEKVLDCDYNRYYLINSKYYYYLIDDDSSSFEEINPNNQIKATMTFEIPKGESYSFAIFQDAWNDGATLEIVNLF